MPGEEVPPKAGIEPQAPNIPQKPGPVPAFNNIASESKSSASAQPDSEPLPAKLARLESDFAALKRELQAILLDLREKLLEAENPFKATPTPGQSAINPPRAETRSNEAKPNTK